MEREMKKEIDKFGQYLSLKIPTDGYAIVSTIGVLMDGSHTFSLETWLRLNGMGMNISILKKEGLFNFGISHGKLTLYLGDDLPYYSFGNTKILSRRWNHVAVTYDGYFLCFYINGEQCGRIATTLCGQEVKSGYHIGTNLDGHIRMLRVYNTCLNGGAIKASLFDNQTEVRPCADFDFTCNPPIDHCNSTQFITLQGRSKMILLEPALCLKSTAYAELSPINEINPGGCQIDPYTLQASIFVTGVQARQTIFVNGNHDMDAGIGLYLRYESENGGYRLCSLRGTDTSVANKVTSKTIIKTDTWVNVATVYDGQSVGVYIDGKLDNTENNIGPILMPLDKSNLLIGGMLESGRPSGTNTLQGYIRRIDVWERALLDAEVKEYVQEIPDINAIGLSESFDFTNEPYRGSKLSIPVALYDNACLMERISDAPMGICEPSQTREKVKSNPVLLLRERQKLDIATLEKSFASLYKTEMAGSMIELTSALGIEPSDADIRQIAEHMKIVVEEQHEILLSVTHYIEGTDYVVVAHYRSSSEAIARYAVNTIDDCVLRVIEMLFMLIGGAIAALFGLRATLSQKATDYIIREIMSIVMVKALIGKGKEFKGSDVYELGHILYSNGLLNPLTRLLVDLGFWNMIRLLAKMVLTFIGVAWVETIASLIATAATFTIKFIDYVKHCIPPPQIALYSLTFNHDLTRNDISALNLRHNANNLIQLPEWMNGGRINEPVAYAIGTMNNVDIKARFVMTYIVPVSLSVRGIAIDGNPLGNLGPVQALFVPGFPGQITFTINNAVIAGLFIGYHRFSWRWEYEIPSQGGWLSMTTTTHDIFLLANSPVGHWNQQPAISTNWPRIDFLKLTARWMPIAGLAQGTVLAEHFTREIYTSGMLYAGMILYLGRLPTGGLSYNLTQFIANATANFATTLVECTDCAFILSLITSLWDNVSLCCVYLQNGIGLQTSYLIAIGGTTWNQHNWTYHVIATNGAVPTVPGNSVYDCCIKLDISTNPWRMGVAPLPLPIPIIPGEPGHLMNCGTLNPPIPIPYVIITDYFDRLLGNNIADRIPIIETNMQITQLI